MTVTIYRELEQGSDAWLQARCGLLTASTIGRLITPTLKTADNEGSRGLALTLAAERITGHVERGYVGWDMERGHEDEPWARLAYTENHAPVEQIGFIVREEPGLKIGYSPDGVVGDAGLVEIKSRIPKEHLKTILADEPPKEFIPQMQTGLFVSGRKWIDFISFSAGLPLYVKRVHPDTAWFTAIDAAARAFETNIADIITRYTTATNGLPQTERRPEFEDIRI